LTYLKKSEIRMQELNGVHGQHTWVTSHDLNDMISVAPTSLVGINPKMVLFTRPRYVAADHDREYQLKAKTCFTHCDYQFLTSDGVVPV
jgi:hypothetical protein